MVQVVLSDEEKAKKLAELRELLKSKEDFSVDNTGTATTTSETADDDKEQDSNTPTTSKPYRGISASLTDADCYRFLRARNYQIPATLDMTLNWYVWYHTPLSGSTYTPKDMRRRALEEGDAQENVYRELLPHSNLGVDKEGRPVYWEKTGLISSRFPKIKTMLTEDDIYNR